MAFYSPLNWFKKTWKKFWGKEWPNDDHGEEAESQEDINDAEPKTILSQVGSSAQLDLVLMLNRPWVNNLVGAVKCCPIIGTWVVQKWIPENRSYDRLWMNRNTIGNYSTYWIFAMPLQFDQFYSFYQIGCILMCYQSASPWTSQAKILNCQRGSASRRVRTAESPT